MAALGSERSGDGTLGTADVWATFGDHIRVEAGGAIPRVLDFDAMSLDVSKQAFGLVGEGSCLTVGQPRPTVPLPA